MAKYPAAIQRPTNKHGYPNADDCLGEGLVAHSMEGSLAAAFGELDNPARQASWHFSVAKDGKVYQHIDTTDISWASGSFDANVKFWSIEHEGVAGQPLTPAQLAATTELMRWLLAQKNLPPVRKQHLWEHREMTQFGSAATACPSGRIPWATIIPALQEDDMTLTAGQQAQLTDIQKDVDDLKAQNVELHLKAIQDKLDAVLAELTTDVDEGAAGTQPRLARVHERVEHLPAQLQAIRDKLDALIAAHDGTGAHTH